MSRNKGAVEEIFIKATRIQSLAVGLVYYLSATFKRREDTDEHSVFLRWASAVAIESLQTGMDIMPSL